MLGGTRGRRLGLGSKCHPGGHLSLSQSHHSHLGYLKNQNQTPGRVAFFLFFIQVGKLRHINSEELSW